MKRFFLCATLVASVLVFIACNDDTVPVAVVPDAILIDTINPETGNIVVTGEYIGAVEPDRQVAVIPRIPGEVINVYFSVGDTVEAGDILFTIDATEIENSIIGLEAQLEVQNAMVQAALTGISLIDGTAMAAQVLQADGGVNQAAAAVRQAEEGIEQVRIGIEQAQMGYDLAEQAYRDTTLLFEAGIVARIAFDQAQAGYLNAAAMLEQAQSGYAIANIGLNTARQMYEQAREGQRILVEDMPEENLRRAQDGLAQAQAARNTLMVNLDLARERLDDAYVRAPIGGVIEMRMVEPFGFANPAAPAFIISDQDTLNVSFRVPRNAAEHISVGDEITLADGDVSGVITEVAATVDMGGLIAVRAKIPYPPANLIGGMTVRIFADAQRALGVPIVPLGVIHYDRGLPHVYIEDGGFARRVRVETGIFNAHYIQIISGVDAADNIIRTWSARLTDGVEVRRQGGA